MKAGVILFHNYGDNADALEVGLSQNGDTLKGGVGELKHRAGIAVKYLKQDQSKSVQLVKFRSLELLNF